MSRGHRCASILGMLGADRICTVLWWSVFGMSGSHRCAFRNYTQSMFGVDRVSGSAVVFFFHVFLLVVSLCVFFMFCAFL